ncbi:MAG: tetraacyldisaccharide 4'-kinase [Acidobacteriaceae bacterium]
MPFYAAGLAAKDGLRRVGALRTRRLKWPVVSVGSLSAGGAGKTPVVIALAALLRARGWAVDVLSRGYRRGGRGAERVDPGAKDAARRFGDEPAMIALRTGVPVWVGAERYAAGMAAEAASGPHPRGVHLLDDGFQHRGLARAVDVVLVTSEDLGDALLPAGNRREGLGALNRADVLVVREEEREIVLPRMSGRLAAGAAIWTVRRTIELAVTPPGLDSGLGLVAFCAIARPENFVAMLRATGIRVVDSIAFSDHHRYTGEDMRRITEVLRLSGAGAFITTEKDAVKITTDLRTRLEAVAPLLVARLHAEFVDSDAVIRELEGRIS